MKDNLKTKVSDEAQSPAFLVGAVIVRFIPFFGLLIADRTHITPLFALYHYVSCCTIGVYLGVKIAMSLNGL